jgi:hypothetical protein
MPIPHHAAKVDANKPDIVKALERCGVRVYDLKKPVDLLCSHRGVWFVIEVKNPDGRDRMTQEQAKFIAESQAEVHIVRTPMEALRAVLGPEHVTMIGGIPAGGAS